MSENIKDPYAPTRTILVDFDGTLCPFNWPNPPGEPYINAVEELNRLYDQGFHIVIFTARLWSGWDRIDTDGKNTVAARRAEIEVWAAKYGLKYHEISAEKRPCVLLLDDSAIRAGDDFPWSMLREYVRRALAGGNMQKVIGLTEEK